MPAQFVLLPRQRWEWPRPPARVNPRTKLGASCLFAALYNVGSGPLYDVAVGGGIGSLMDSKYTSGPVVPCVVSVAGQHIEFGNPTKLQFTNTSDFTIVSLFSLNSVGQSFPQIFSNDSGIGGRTLLQWRLDADRLEGLIGTTNAALGGVTGAAVLSAQTLYMGAFVRVHGVSLSVYLNGKLDVTGADASTGTWTVGSSVWASMLVGIGTNALDGRKYFDFIFGRALTAGEIAELWSDPFSMFATDALPLAQLALFVRPFVAPPPPTGTAGRLVTCGHPISTACQDWLLT